MNDNGNIIEILKTADMGEINQAERERRANESLDAIKNGHAVKIRTDNCEVSIKKLNMQTKTIANHPVTLQTGVRYVASRAIAERGVTVYPVSIHVAPLDLDVAPVEVIDGLDYDEANKFLSAFNNGSTSFAGRVW